MSVLSVLFSPAVRAFILPVLLLSLGAHSLAQGSTKEFVSAQSFYGFAPSDPGQATAPSSGGLVNPLKASVSIDLQHIAEVAPLTPRQKFALFGAFTIDPITLGAAGGIAGVEQAANVYPGFRQGARGYSRRYGTAYADLFTAEFLGEALLPSLFRQDPRYFYKGEGTLWQRTRYAAVYSVIGRGDTHARQLNYSRLLGDLGSGGISNLYYPMASRRGASLTFYNFGFAVASQAATNLLQEFILHRSTGVN